MRLILFVTLLLGISGQSFAQSSAADVLLNEVDTSAPSLFYKEEVKKAQQQANEYAQMKIDDGFLMILFAEWRNTRNLHPLVNTWVMSIFKHDFENAAHQWNLIEKDIPEDFATAANVAQTYLLWRLGLAQTFFNRYAEHVFDADTAKSRSFVALDQLVAPALPQWFVDNAIYVSSEQIQKAEKLEGEERGQVAQLIRAWGSLKNGPKAMKVLQGLPRGHALKLAVANTAVIYLAKLGQLGDAGRILKAEVEPEIERIQDPTILADHYLTLARLLYQAGALEASASFYQKIPNSLPEYLSARTELTWVFLRQNDLAKLRGELQTLSSQVFDQRFIPETYLVRSISNLKLCQFEQVNKDFQQFINSNKKWAKVIETALASEQVKEVEKDDFYTSFFKRGQKVLQSEREKLTSLAKNNISTQYWQMAISSIEKVKGAVSTRLEREKRRYWKNRKIVLDNTIRKMRFVKIEVLSQVRMATLNGGRKLVSNEGDQVSNVQASTTRGGELQTYKYDGVFWPDELFRLQAKAKNYCLSKNKISKR